MVISLVVAAAENNAIGKNNTLLWHLPNDMAFFKNTTWGMPVIMGRKTYDSMKTPLKGRTNIILSKSSKPGDFPEGVLIAATTEDAVRMAEETDSKECYVIGGGEIYRQFMDVADKIYLTRVHTSLEGDVFFPAIDMDEWRLAEETHFDADSRHAFAYTFQTWVRKKRN